MLLKSWASCMGWSIRRIISVKVSGMFTLQQRGGSSSSSSARHLEALRGVVGLIVCSKPIVGGAAPCAVDVVDGEQGPSPSRACPSRPAVVTRQRSRPWTSQTLPS
eukprot:587440-Pyramimonas_sp.AAC.1